MVRLELVESRMESIDIEMKNYPYRIPCGLFAKHFQEDSPSTTYLGTTVEVETQNKMQVNHPCNNLCSYGTPNKIPTID